MELMLTRGRDTSNRTIENLMPKKDASNIVMGIRHMAEAQI